MSSSNPNVAERLAVRAKPNNMKDGMVQDVKVEAKLGARASSGIFPLITEKDFDELDEPKSAAIRLVEALEEASKFFDLRPESGFRYVPMGVQRPTVVPVPVESTKAHVVVEQKSEVRRAEAPARVTNPASKPLVLVPGVKKHLPESFASGSVSRADLERVLDALPFSEARHDGEPVDMTVLGHGLREMKPATFALAVCALEFIGKVGVTRPRTAGKPWVVRKLEPNLTDEDVRVLTGA